jgi:hypothetical protein
MRYTRKRIEGSNPSLSAEKENKLSVQVILEQAVYFFYGLSILPSTFKAPPMVLTC